jgi:hypothetical protein
VSWDDSKVYVALSREMIKHGPRYHPEALNRKYEEALYDHYKRPKYWDVEFHPTPAAIEVTD